MVGLGRACFRSMRTAASRRPATAKEAIARYEWKALAAGTSISPISTSKATAQMIETTLIAFVRGFRGEWAITGAEPTCLILHKCVVGAAGIEPATPTMST